MEASAMDDRWMVGLLREAADMLEASLDAGDWVDAEKTAQAAAFVSSRLAHRFGERHGQGLPPWMQTMAQRIAEEST